MKYILRTALALCMGAAVAAAAGVPARVYADVPEVLENRPEAAEHFSAEEPASVKPVLTWTKVHGAVAYELELFKPEGDTTAGEEPVLHRFFTTKHIFVPGYNVVLPDNYEAHEFYWHVRGLDMDDQPIGDYSGMERVPVDAAIEAVQKPVPTSVFNEGNGTTLLYPVYAWIPVNGAAKYEVEILNHAPENPNGTAPSQYRIDSAEATGFDHYDDYARISTTPFYWRVRGLDKEGKPVGVYSNAGMFSVNPDDNYTVATYGDSISHGGGSISYSPADWEFSYQHYLHFDSINLAQSGDTSAMTVERFDKDVLPFHPQYLIILMGTNSLRAGVPAEDVIGDMKTVKEKCLNHGIRPVFLTLPPINPANIKRAFDEPTADDWQELFQKVNDYIRTQVHVDVTTDMYDADGTLPTRLALDGIHLDPPGKEMMADAINAAWPVITSLPDSAWT